MDDEVLLALDELRARVAALEAAGHSRSEPVRRGDLSIVQALVDALDHGDGSGSDESGGDGSDGGDEVGTLVYAGAGRGADGVTALQREHGWRSVTDQDPDLVAATLAALGNRHRVRIVQILLTGDATTGELANSLGEGTTGQLFHHLKELSAAGLIHQPRRGRYSIRQPDVVPLLTVLAVGADLSGHPGHDPVAD